MQYMKRISFIVAVFLFIALFSIHVFAVRNEPSPPLPSDVVLEGKIIKDKAFPGEWLAFDLTIRNLKIADDNFRIKVDEENLAWSVLSKPMPINNIILLGRHSKTFHLLFKDLNLKRDEKKPYGIAIRVESLKTGSVYIMQLPVLLLPGNLDYSNLPPNITVSLTAPDFLDPHNKYSIKVNLHNNNLRPYKNLDVLLNSKIIHKTFTVDLDGEEAKAIDFTLSFPPQQPPMQDMLTFSLVSNTTVLATGQIPLVIVASRIPFNQTVLVTENFLKRQEEITLRNTENVREEQVFRVAMPLFKGLVSSAEPSATVETIDNVRYFSWPVELSPGEKTRVTVYTNYRIYLYLICFIGLVVFLYFMLKNPIVIIKQAENIKTIQGGIAEVKVVLTIHNVSNKMFQCHLQERIPLMIEHLKREHPGLVAPDKVITTKHGTVLRWLFDLEPKEERFVVYYLKTKLHVLGGIRIPPAVAKVKAGEIEITIRSNELDIATE